MLYNIDMVLSGVDSNTHCNIDIVLSGEDSNTQCNIDMVPSGVESNTRGISFNTDVADIT